MALKQRLRPFLTPAACALAIILGAYLLHRPVLVAAGTSGLYPWGSDTLGHIFRFEYLGQALAAGEGWPDLFPDWYLGIQLTRYYPPLSYYLLLGLAGLVGDSILAVNLFIFLAACLGGLSWLLLRRWLGLPLALVGGLLFLALPDNLRVAFSEGNLPRVLANALVPVLVFLLLLSLEARPRRWPLLGLSLVMALVVVSHPMMAAIYAVVCGLILLFSWVGQRATFSHMVLALSALFVGIMLPGFWLFPSLTGGITELNSSAVSRGLDVISWSVHLNPLLRAANPETIYIGATLLAMPLLAILARQPRSPQARAMAFAGWFGVLITTPGFNQLFNALPLSSLLWPLRFLGIVSVLLLLSTLWVFSGWKDLSPWWLAAALLAIGLDFSGSLRLIHMRPLRPEIREVAGLIAAQPGWRQATLDHSRLGSAPSYFFTAQAGREQVYGWAYQGARTATNVASLNEAMRLGANAYLLDRLSLLGVDDVVLLSDHPGAARTALALENSDFQTTYRAGPLNHYHRSGAPRAVVADWTAIGIGRGALNYAYLFPEIVLGDRPHLDDYSLRDLQGFQKVILSGFTWRDRQAAEDLVEDLARSGVAVYIDLTGTQADPLARIPHFLEVWGEPIILAPEPILAALPGASLELGPFVDPGGLWHTLTPQGLDEKVVTFDHLGQTATIAGYRQLGEMPVWFLGINLVYEALLTREPASGQLLADLLGLQLEVPRPHQTIPLSDYQAAHDGYRFTYQLDTPATLLMPVARHDGTVLYIDGAPAKVRSLENLVVFEAPAGEHTVEIAFHPPWIYALGRWASVLAAAGLAGLLVPQWRVFRKQGTL